MSRTVLGRNVYGKGVDEILMRTDPTVNSGQPFYYQEDHEGSVTHLTNASGTVIEKYRYDAFGAPTFYNGSGTQIPATAYNNRFLFTGREYTGSLGFYEYRARAYNPTLGRFMSEDPKGFDAGDYNLFRYVGNDPLDRTDPMGLAPTGFIWYPTPDRVWDWAQRHDHVRDTMELMGAGAISIGMHSFQFEQRAKIHDPIINGKNYDASTDYGELGRSAGIKAEEQLQLDPEAAHEMRSYVGQKGDGSRDFIASQPEGQFYGHAKDASHDMYGVNYSDIYNKRADPTGKNDPLRGTGYRTVAAVVAQRLYRGGISKEDQNSLHKAGLDGYIAVPSPRGRNDPIRVWFWNEHNVY